MVPGFDEVRPVAITYAPTISTTATRLLYRAMLGVVSVTLSLRTSRIAQAEAQAAPSAARLPGPIGATPGRSMTSTPTKPTTTALHEVLLPQSTSDGQDYERVDVTELVRDMLSAPSSNHGFLMRLQDEVVKHREVSFTSSDYAVDVRRPKLEVVFRRP